MKALESLADQWDRVGGCLYIPEAVRRRIASECSSNMECLRQLVRCWLLRDPHASWRRLIWCLDMVDDDAFRKVADSIRRNAEQLEGQ